MIPEQLDKDRDTMAQQKAPAAPGKKTRGDGDASFMFADKAGKADLKRISDSVVQLVVKQKAGDKVKAYNVATLPDNVKTALAAAGLAARGKMYIANHCEKPEDVLATFDAFWAENSTGKFSAAKEGGPRGRAPSVTNEMYVEALVRCFKQWAQQKRVPKPMSEKDIADKLNQLNALDTAERNAKYIKVWMKNDLYRKHIEDVKRENRKPEEKQEADQIIAI